MSDSTRECKCFVSGINVQDVCDTLASTIQTRCELQSQCGLAIPLIDLLTM
jgi:hypothetical protein